MNSIHSTNEFDIYQDQRKSTIFTITHNNNNNNNTTTDLMNILFNSIIKTKIINNSTLLTQNNETKSIIFKALSVESFEKFKERHKKINGNDTLSHNLLLNIIYSLTKQISYLLHNNSKCFYKLENSNILVIDNCKFIYLSYEHLKDVDVKDNKMIIYRPISKTTGYISPELKNAKSIPILFSYKTIFYSLGLLILDSIKNSEIELSEDANISDKLDKLDKLLCIKDTKLYFFLERCLSIDPDKRFLLYV
jgi:hypothetical protein